MESSVIQTSQETPENREWVAVARRADLEWRRWSYFFFHRLIACNSNYHSVSSLIWLSQHDSANARAQMLLDSIMDFIPGAREEQSGEECHCHSFAESWEVNSLWIRFLFSEGKPFRVDWSWEIGRITCCRLHPPCHFTLFCSPSRRFQVRYVMLFIMACTFTPFFRETRSNSSWVFIWSVNERAEEDTVTYSS